MGRKSVWKIPVKTTDPGYQKMLTACKHFGKPWDQLTKDEQKWERPATTSPNVGKRIADAENCDDLYFLADAMMATCKALEETNGLLRDMLEEAKRERQ